MDFCKRLVRKNSVVFWRRHSLFKIFFAISFDLKSFTIYNVADDNEDLEYEWKETVSGKYSINNNIVNLIVEKDNLTIPCEIEKDIMYYSDTRMKLYKQ